MIPLVFHAKKPPDGRNRDFSGESGGWREPAPLLYSRPARLLADEVLFDVCEWWG